jgi:DnaJ-class molecular chaperone
VVVHAVHAEIGAGDGVAIGQIAGAGVGFLLDAEDALRVDVGFALGFGDRILEAGGGDAEALQDLPVDAEVLDGLVVEFDEFRLDEDLLAGRVDFFDDFFDFSQAALGDDIIVPTLKEKVSYKIPAGTQPDTIFRLKGKGIKSLRTSKLGDLYVKVTLEVPTKLTGEQKKLIAKLGESLNPDGYSKKKKFADTMKEIFKS